MNRFWLLGSALPPLLGATQTLENALAIGLSALLLVLSHQALMLPLHRMIGAARIVASLMLAAALTSCLQLGLNAWALPLALGLGHYPALLSLHCLAVDALAPHTGRWSALIRHLLGLTALCLILSACRQWLGQSDGVHLANLTPGALILLGLLLALYNRLRPAPATSSRQGTL
ncbi:TPA: Rnf-Nqr domain containing protein [Pseudomonas putida]